jgi:hypothetical protein
MKDTIITSLFAAAILAGQTVAAFTVYDNTDYQNVTIGHGSTPINWVPNYVCSPLVSSGGLPDETQWKSIVSTWNEHPGYPLVLDCEDLYISGNASNALNHYQRLLSLQTWAAEVVPAGQTIGWYGLVGNTPSTYYSYYRQLIAAYPKHAYFPSAYTFSASTSTWKSTLESNIAIAQAVNSSIPIYPYIWPQYHSGSTGVTAYSFIPAAQWTTELDDLHAESGLSGFVIWGGNNTAACNASCQAFADGPWVGATQTFLDSIY